MRRTGSLITALREFRLVSTARTAVLLSTCVLLAPSTAFSVEPLGSRSGRSPHADGAGRSTGQAVGAFARRWSARKAQHRAARVPTPRPWDQLRKRTSSIVSAVRGGALVRAATVHRKIPSWARHRKIPNWARVRERTEDVLRSVPGSAKVRSVVDELDALLHSEQTARVVRAAGHRVGSLMREAPPLASLAAWLRGKAGTLKSWRLGTAAGTLRSFGSSLVDLVGRASFSGKQRPGVTLAFLALFTLQAQAFTVPLAPAPVPDQYTQAYYEILLKKATGGPGPAMDNSALHIVGSEDLDHVFDAYGAGHLLIPLHQGTVEINPEHLKLGAYELHVRMVGETEDGQLKLGHPRKLFDFSKDSYKQRLFCERKAPNWVHYKAKGATMETDGKTKILLPYDTSKTVSTLGSSTKGQQPALLESPSGQRAVPVSLAQGGLSHEIVQRGKQHEVVVERQGEALVFDLAEQGSLATSLGVRLAPPPGQRNSASLTKGSYMIGPTPKGPWKVLADDVRHWDNEVRYISLAAAAEDPSLRYVRVGFNWYVPDAAKMVASFAFSSDSAGMVARSSDAPDDSRPITSDRPGSLDGSL